MAKAGSQPGMMVYMMAVPASYENNGQPQAQGWAMGHDSYGNNNFGNGQAMLMPVQTDSRGQTFAGGQTMLVAPMQADGSGNSWNGNWQQMPDQSQQWAGGWDQSQSGGMQQHSQQQPWTNPMAGNPSGMMPQGHQSSAMQTPGQQQQHQQPQQFNMQQQQHHVQMQQQQIFVPQQQFHQGSMQAQQQQPQFSQQQMPPNEQTPMGQRSPEPTPASLTAKPKRKGLTNKPIAKDMGPTPSETEQPKEQLGQAPMVPTLTQSLASPAPTPAPVPPEQRVRKGLVNKSIAKEGSIGPAAVTPVESPKDPEPVGPPPAVAETKPKKGLSMKGLLNKPISKDPAVETKPKEAVAASAISSPAPSPVESPAPSPAPVQKKAHLDMKAIAAWEPSKSNESDNKSMIKALGLEPVNSSSTRSKPKPRPSNEVIQDAETSPTPAEPKKGFRLKNAAIVRPGGTTPKESVARDSESSKPVESTKVAEPKAALPHAETTPKASQESSVNAKTVGAVLLGRAGEFSREKMLQFWKAAKDLPIKDLGYHTAADKTPSWRRDTKTKKPEGLSNQSANPYKKKIPTNREEALTKQVRGLLNLICPDNKEKIIKRFYAEVKVENGDELEIVIGIIFHKVTDDPHHCVTYVDMVRSLSQSYPEFQQAVWSKPIEYVEGSCWDKVREVLGRRENDEDHVKASGDRVMTMNEMRELAGVDLKNLFPICVKVQAPTDFRRMLVNQCQNKFDDLLACTDSIAEEGADMDQEEYEELVMRQKKNALATMKFIGFLYLRKLIAAAVIRSVVKDLLSGSQESPDFPPDLQVEYAMELIQTTGHEFDKTEKDKYQLNAFFARLDDLKKSKKPDGKPCLSKRLQFAIEDLVDMRNGGWEKSKHKEEAKKLDDVREDQEREEREQAHAKGAQRGPKGKGKGWRH